MHTATVLPYSPFLQAITCQPVFGRFVLDILSSQLAQLLSLTLHCHSLVETSSLPAALASNTQLTELSISVHIAQPRAGNTFTNRIYPQRGATDLPPLPNLRSLSLQQPCLCTWDVQNEDLYGCCFAVPISIDSLSEMRLLTSLAVSTSSAAHLLDRWRGSARFDTFPAMAPVCNALGSLPELQVVRLECCPCDWIRQGGPGWPDDDAIDSPDEDEFELPNILPLAASLPTLQRLTRLELLQLFIDPDCDSSNLRAFASSLSRCSLTLTGFNKAALSWSVPWLNTRRE